MLNLLILFITLSCVPACSKTKLPPEPPRTVQESVLPQGWYSQDAATLNNDLEQYLTLAQKRFSVQGNPENVKALISPHASYFYSGLCAATAYQTLLSGSLSDAWTVRKNKKINKVIVLSPCHTALLHGIALPKITIYRTALGDIPINYQSLHTLSKHPLFTFNQEPFVREHAVEMQLPFLQKTVDHFSLVPLIVGQLKDNEPLLAAQELAKIIDENTLVVVSSDFVHYGKSYEYEPCTNNILATIRMIDSHAAQAITHQSIEGFYRLLGETKATICGQMPLKVLLCLHLCKALDAVHTQTTCYYTSAQLLHAMQQDKTIVIDKLFEALPDKMMQTSVSYLGMTLSTSEASNSTKTSLTGYEQKALLTWARTVLAHALHTPQEILPLPLLSAGLEQRVGAFVTLKNKDHSLRGCIGRISSDEPLYKTVRDMSTAAAFNDTRFTPLTAKELDIITIEITTLSNPVLAERYQDFVLGKHGIILNKIDPETGKKIASAVFLPQVPGEQGWNETTTLEQLSLKAGLPKDGWKQHCEFYLFEGFEMHEQQLSR